MRLRQLNVPAHPGRPGLFASERARRAVLTAWLAVTLTAAAAAVLGFRIDNSVGVWFARDDPALTDYRQFLADFGGREWMLVGIEQQSADGAPAAADRRTLVQRLGAMEHVLAVLSAADLPAESDLVKEFLKPDPTSAAEALLVQITNDIERQDGYRETLITDIRAAAGTLPTVSAVHVAGTPVINGELNRAARRDMFLFFPAVALFVALLGALVFRNARDTAVLLSVSLGTVVVTEGLLIGAGHPLNMVTIMLPTVLIALSVADTIHLIHAFHACNATANDSAAAATRAVQSILWPCAGTSATTVAGFLAFAGSSVRPIFQLAIFASFGIALAWLLTVTAAPILLSALWRGRTRAKGAATLSAETLLARWAHGIDRHPRWIAGAFALGAVTLIGLTSLRADTDYVKFFRAGSRVPRDYDALQRAGFPQNPLDLVIQLPAGASPLAPATRASLDTFARGLETLPDVHAVLSPFAMPASRGAFGEPIAQAAGMVSADGRQVRMTAMTDYPSSRALFRLMPEIRALAREVLPAGARLIPTGTSWLWARMDDGVIRTQKQSLAIVCVVCFVILALLFRSVSLGALGLAMSLYPVAMVLGLMGLLDIPVNMATVLIAGIAVGLAVDDTIHFVHAYHASRGTGADRHAACERAMVDVGLRIVMTSLVLVGAFAGMGLSDFMPTSQFGLLSSLTVVLALAADMALLPTVLTWRRARSAAELPARSAWGVRSI